MYFLMFLKKNWFVSILVFFSFNIIGLDLEVTVSEPLTALYNMQCMNMSGTSRNLGRRNSSTETVFEEEQIDSLFFFLS